ncbi:sterol desaturase family protein [Zavarzinella formosa]|uniref:sterol desaturase family protein n=1 Tax=Zavarzinella formosa TaxID=360055 RepID=UPI0002DBBAAF|nr:sterol desaturase family protein [Zavarzinella formosa]
MNIVDRTVAALAAGGAAAVSDGLWYAGGAAAIWLVFYTLFRRRLASRKIVQRPPTRKQITRELIHSLRSILVFATVTGIVVFAALGGHTRLYRHVDDHGWEWFFASILIAVMMHDTYFYWTHRLMHHRRLYRIFHRTHHLSTNPTPWAAYAFSVPEAFVQAGIGPLVVCTIPMHGVAFTAFMGWQIAFNVLGHGGYEIFPRWFLGTWAGRLLNTPTHHALHHEKFIGSYGLYFNIWDRLMGTNHRDYEARFTLAAGSPATPVDPAPELVPATNG